MNNKILEKIFFILIITFLNLLLFNYNVQAKTEDILPTISMEENFIIENALNNEDEHFMVIDSATGETEELELNTDKVTTILNEMKKSKTYSTSLINPNNIVEKNKVPSLLESFSSKSTVKTVCLNAPQVASQRIICKVIFDTGSGSGFLIGKNYLLTAGHCVLDSAGVVKSGWRAYPGYQDWTALAEMGWNRVYYSSNYSPASSTDWAIVELDGDYGDSVGWMYVTKYYNYSDMVGVNVTSWGYSGDTLDAQWLCYSSGSITSAYSSYFNASCSVYEGMSGGPTRISDNTAVGINVAKYDDANSTLKAVRIDDNLFDLILDLLSQ